jgi:hypothetical protein
VGLFLFVQNLHQKPEAVLADSEPSENNLGVSSNCPYDLYAWQARGHRFDANAITLTITDLRNAVKFSLSDKTMT